MSSNQVPSNLVLDLHPCLTKIYITIISKDWLPKEPYGELFLSTTMSKIWNSMFPWKIDGIDLKVNDTSLRQSQLYQNIAATPIRSFFPMCVVPLLATQFTIIWLILLGLSIYKTK
jgi:hypothetical protein